MFKRIFYFILSMIMFISPLFSMEYEYIENDKIVIAKGTIEPKEFNKFKKFIDGKDVNKIFLESKGGSAYDGLLISLFIRSKGIDTVVLDKKVCASACAFIWIGGKNRYLQENSMIMFHRPYDSNGKVDEESLALLSWTIGMLKYRDVMVIDLMKTNPITYVVFSPYVALRWGINVKIYDGKENLELDKH